MGCAGCTGCSTGCDGCSGSCSGCSSCSSSCNSNCSSNCGGTCRDLVPHLVPAVAAVAHLVRQIALTIVEILVVHNALGWLLRQYINIKIKENDMRILKIEIDQETVNYIERLHYEVEQRKDIIQRLIEAHANDADATVHKPCVSCIFFGIIRIYGRV